MTILRLSPFPPPSLPARLLLAALLLMAAMSPPLARAATPTRGPQVTGTVDHSFMGAEETFIYVISVAGGGQSGPPDVSPLSRDFEIVSRARRSRAGMFDGRPATVDEWVLLLAPKRAGILTVPGLSVGGISSKPLKIEVVPALPVSQPTDLPLYVRVDAGNAAPYAQSLVPVVVRVFDRLGIQEGRIGLPTSQDGALTAQGEQRVYSRTVGKQRYGIIEQSYLFQPQKSGTAEIDPITVVATVPGRGGPSSSSLPALLGRAPMPNRLGDEVTVESRPLRVDVQPRPPATVGWFLPAVDVNLTQEWSSPPEKAQVGVALTRTLRLKARGASPNQLPPLPPAPVEGVRQYEDDRASEATTIDGMTSAELVKTISVVPAQAGTFTLPAVEVGWWNTRTNRQEQAVLPAVTLNVAPAPGAAPPDPTPAPSAAPPPQAQPEPEAPPATGTPLAPLIAWIKSLSWLVWPAMGGLVILSAAGMFAWRRRAAARRRAMAQAIAAQRLAPARAKPSVTPRTQAHASAEAAEQALVAACKANQAQLAHTAFLAWVRLSGGAGFEDPRMAPALRALCEALYGARSEPWRGKAFLAAFRAEQKARRRASRSGRRGRIAPLYPTR